MAHIRGLPATTSWNSKHLLGSFTTGTARLSLRRNTDHLCDQRHTPISDATRRRRRRIREATDHTTSITTPTISSSDRAVTFTLGDPSQAETAQRYWTSDLYAMIHSTAVTRDTPIRVTNPRFR